MDMSQFEGLSEGELKELMEKAESYEERSKIRAAIRSLKKSQGGISRKMTGTSIYRRPGFQTPRNVQIPNSVTGNVLPSSLKDGESIKPPDKNTPTIGYLNATTVKNQKRPDNKTPSQSSYANPDAMKESETWWTNKSRSQTPSDTSEQRVDSTRSDSTEPVFTETSSKPHSEYTPSPEPEPVRDPIPEPVRDPTPEPVHDPTPEPVRDPTPEPVCDPTPEPINEPSPEPVHEPSPEPVHEPSPEPVHDPTPEPVHEPTPEPIHEPSPEPVHEDIPSPEPKPLVESEPNDYSNDGEYEDEDNRGDHDEGFSDDADEELRVLEEGSKTVSDEKQPQLDVNKSLPLDVLQKVEPGLAENKDFRTKLRKAEDAKIDTKAAFPSQKSSAEQLDFRNVLRKTVGPEKKSFKVEQVDFRDNLRPKGEDGFERGSKENLLKIDEPVETRSEKDLTPEIHKSVSPDERKVSPVAVDEEDSYEARKEARRKQKELREQQLKEIETKVGESVTNGINEDSYEARREARRKAREAKKLKEQENKPKELTYKEKQQLEQAKRMEENKKKWDTLDQANGNGEKPPLARQRSSGAQRGAQQLLAWCQHKTRYYEHVEVKDFSQSFANGLALCAILHSFVPDEIPYDDLSPDNQTENFTVALQVAENLGIGSFFDVEDLVSVKAPDPKSMMTFLATIYQHFK